MTWPGPPTEAAQVPNGYAHLECAHYEHPTIVFPRILIPGDSAACMYCADPIGDCAPDLPRRWVGRAVIAVFFLTLMTLVVVTS